MSDSMRPSIREEMAEQRSTIAALQRENAALKAAILAAEWEGADACAMPACPFCGADRPSNWPEVGDDEPHDVDCPVRRIKALTPSAAPGEGAAQCAHARVTCADCGTTWTPGGGR